MSTINVDNVLPQSGNLVTVNGAGIKKTSTSVSVGPGNYFGNPPLPNDCAFLGIAAGGIGGTQKNTAVGYISLGALTTGSFNTALGQSSGQNVSSGNSNTMIGSGSGVFITTGNANTCLGSGAGGALDGNSSTNTFIGENTGSLTGGLITGQGNTCIGAGASPSSTTASFEFTLGNWVNVLRCQQTSITSLSDARDKKEIEELPVGLDFVKGLKPVKFVWDERDEEGRHDIKDFGFIAQDLKKSQEDAELADTLKLVYESNPEKLEASYGKLVPILVKAIQELTAKVEALEAK
jgi:hypothetical protein